MPHLKELHEKYGEKGLVIVGVHTVRAGEKAADFVREKEIPYAVGIDSKGKGELGLTNEAYRVDSYPDYYLVDRKGILRFADLANSEVDAAIAYLLAEPAPKEGK